MLADLAHADYWRTLCVCVCTSIRRSQGGQMGNFIVFLGLHGSCGLNNK